ncbi:MAG: NAD(P)/FAD-dependent oxidoreductase [Planctomycetes bacterium]|nr:NAD(P)/FAD-dependent oxidoreductase [Planctomycetota bacterium]
MDGGGNQPHVVIIGGGFGGLYAAKALKRAPVRITLLDRRNHHVFQPLLYQVATAALAAPDIAAPIRKILRRQRNVTVMLANADSIDAPGKRVVLSDGEIHFDYLIVAAGAMHSYFGHDAWAEFAPGLKSIDDAFDIRRRVLIAYEKAERETDAQRRKELLTFVVVGGGPTGVELAGALAEIARNTLTRDFRNVDPQSARVVLLDAGDRLLTPYLPRLSQSAQRQLEGLGVQVVTGARVTAIDAMGVSIGPERIQAATVLWAAGVQSNPLGQSLGVPMDRAGRVQVEPDLSIPGHSNVFVIGDMAAVKWRDGMVPGVAPAAMQMGRFAARAIFARVTGRTLEPFSYVDKGSLATIGRSRAVAQFGKWGFSGIVAWSFWLWLHIFFLIGFRNRMVVLMEWFWAYLTFQRSARIILDDPHARIKPK